MIGVNSSALYHMEGNGDCMANLPLKITLQALCSEKNSVAGDLLLCVCATQYTLPSCNPLTKV